MTPKIVQRVDNDVSQNSQIFLVPDITVPLILNPFCQTVSSETLVPKIKTLRAVDVAFLKISMVNTVIDGLFVCLFVCIEVTSQSTIFQSCQDRATAYWVFNSALGS